jgi:hypothetical protein
VAASYAAISEQGGAATTDEAMVASPSGRCTSVGGNDGLDEQGSATTTTPDLSSVDSDDSSDSEGSASSNAEVSASWEPEWGARQTVAARVEVEDAPCSTTAPVEDRRASASSASADAVLESLDIHWHGCSAAVYTEPMSSLVSLPGWIEKKPHVLLRAAGALGCAIKGCFGFKNAHS